MKRVSRRIATLLVAILSLSLLSYAGDSGVNSGSDISFPVEIETKNKIITINIINTLIATPSESDIATPSDATPSDATLEKPERPIKPFNPSNEENIVNELKKPIQDEIITIPANIETESSSKVGTITANYEHSYKTNGTESHIATNENGDQIILINNRTLPKTKDHINTLYLLLFIFSIPLIIAFLKKILPFKKNNL